jgi:ABC-2 type transport system permease protein/lipopolysaccharide transport system permease protein
MSLSRSSVAASSSNATPAGASASRAAQAFRDLAEGASRYPLWSTLALLDIRQRYRRSAIGPFWITISMGAMIAGLGFLYAGLFQQRTDSYLPYLAAGLVVWGLISALVVDSCATFIGSEGSIKQIKAPLSVYVYRVVWRNLIVFAHYVWIYVILVLAYSVPVGMVTFFALPGMLILVLNGVWVAMLLGLLCARFRDVPQLVANLVQVVFFVTPIMWSAEQLSDRAVFADINPFYHLIAIVRAPLLGQAPTATNWLVSLGVTVAGSVIAFALFARYRWRIAYWV